MDVKVDTALIKQLRQNRALSQEELAVASGLSLRTVQRIEAEGHMPDKRWPPEGELEVPCTSLNHTKSRMSRCCTRSSGHTPWPRG